MVHIIAGLGNPGSGYGNNRHNVGFMALDSIQRLTLGVASWRRKFNADICDGLIDGHKVILLKPQTYMNLSGQALAEAAHFYKVPPSQIVVIHDELDLAFGRFRVKKGGSNGGHNGLHSITAHLGADFMRLRIGIGHPGHKEAVNRHVLSDFAKAEFSWLETFLELVGRYAGLLLKEPHSAFSNKICLELERLKQQAT